MFLSSLTSSPLNRLEISFTGIAFNVNHDMIVSKDAYDDNPTQIGTVHHGQSPSLLPPKKQKRVQVST